MGERIEGRVEKLIVESRLQKAIELPEGDHLTECTHPPHAEDISKSGEPKGEKEEGEWST